MADTDRMPNGKPWSGHLLTSHAGFLPQDKVGQGAGGLHTTKHSEENSSLVLGPLYVTKVAIVRHAEGRRWNRRYSKRTRFCPS